MEVKGVDIIRGDLLFLSLHHKVYGKNFHFCISFNDKHTYWYHVSESKACYYINQLQKNIHGQECDIFEKKIEIGENFYFSPLRILDFEIFKEKFECPS